MARSGEDHFPVICVPAVAVPIEALAEVPEVQARETGPILGAEAPLAPSPAVPASAAAVESRVSARAATSPVRSRVRAPRSATACVAVEPSGPAEPCVPVERSEFAEPVIGVRAMDEPGALDPLVIL